MAIVAWHKTRDVHQAIEVKKAKDKRIAEILIDEFQFCLAGLNKSGPVSVKIVLDIFTLLRTLCQSCK